MRNLQKVFQGNQTGFLRLGSNAVLPVLGVLFFPPRPSVLNDHCKQRETLYCKMTSQTPFIVKRVSVNAFPFLQELNLDSGEAYIIGGVCAEKALRAC